MVQRIQRTSRVRRSRRYRSNAIISCRFVYRDPLFLMRDDSLHGYKNVKVQHSDAFSSFFFLFRSKYVWKYLFTKLCNANGNSHSCTTSNQNKKKKQKVPIVDGFLKGSSSFSSFFFGFSFPSLTERINISASEAEIKLLFI